MQNAVRPKRMTGLLLAVLFGWTVLSCSSVLADRPRAEYHYGNRRLVLDALDDNLLHLRRLAPRRCGVAPRRCGVALSHRHGCSRHGLSPHWG